MRVRTRDDGWRRIRCKEYRERKTERQTQREERERERRGETKRDKRPEIILAQNR